DGDAALALEIHRVEDLRLHLALGETTAALDEAIRQRRLAVVDVRDDREVADVLHGSVKQKGTRHVPSGRKQWILTDFGSLKSGAQPRVECARARRARARRRNDNGTAHCRLPARPGTA